MITCFSLAQNARIHIKKGLLATRLMMNLGLRRCVERRGGVSWVFLGGRWCLYAGRSSILCLVVSRVGFLDSFWNIPLSLNSLTSGFSTFSYIYSQLSLCICHVVNWWHTCNSHMADRIWGEWHHQLRRTFQYRRRQKKHIYWLFPGAIKVLAPWPYNRHSPDSEMWIFSTAHCYFAHFLQWTVRFSVAGENILARFKPGQSSQAAKQNNGDTCDKTTKYGMKVTWAIVVNT